MNEDEKSVRNAKLREVVETENEAPIRQAYQGAPPVERKRRLNVNLPDEVEEKLRKVAETTGLPIYGLAEHVAGSTLFAQACLTVLRARYDDWWNERKAAEDIFGPELPT